MKTYDPVTSLETRIKDLEEKCRVLKFQNWELAEAKTNLINENYKLKEELDGMAMGNNIKIDIVKYINEGKTAAEISEITGVSARAIGDIKGRLNRKKPHKPTVAEIETEAAEQNQPDNVEIPAPHYGKNRGTGEENKDGGACGGQGLHENRRLRRGHTGGVQ